MTAADTVTLRLSPRVSVQLSMRGDDEMRVKFMPRRPDRLSPGEQAELDRLARLVRRAWRRRNE